MKKLLAVCVLFAGCGGSANLAGSYSVNITNGQNGCNIANWTVGAMSMNIPFTVTQNGVSATGTVQGLVGTYVSALLGNNVFTGDVFGGGFDLKLFGTRSTTTGTCAYTVNAEITGSLMGDFISGTITYTPATNGSPDCGALAGCSSTQSFNGARPATR